MKNHSWLHTLENVSLVGLGVGSVASVWLQQMLYTTAPLSVLVVLGLVNRRRLQELSERRDTSLAEMDRAVSRQLDRLTQQVATLPTPEVIHKMNRGLWLRSEETSEKLHHEIAALKQGLQQRLSQLEQQQLAPVQHELWQLSSQYSRVMEEVSGLQANLKAMAETNPTDALRSSIEQLRSTVSGLQSNLETLSYHTKPSLTALQEQVTRLNRQFAKLPPPVDVGALKQEVAELIKVIAELVPRRDLVSLTNEIKELHQQQDMLRQSVIAIETAALHFKRTLHASPQESPQGVSNEGNSHNSYDSPETDSPTPATKLVLSSQLEAALAEESLQLSHLGTVPSQVYPELQELASAYLTNLRAQLGTIQEFTQQLAQQQQQLREQINQLPHSLDVVALQRQLTDLSQRLPASERAIATFQARIQTVLDQELHAMNRQLQTIAAIPQAELIFDLNADDTGEAGLLTGSRAVLEEALDSTQEQLVLILPWSDSCPLDAALMQKFEAFLSRNGQLAIGWCHLADRDEGRLLNKLRRGWMDEAPHRALQETLHNLLQLKRVFPDRFQFKILGTSENFLVSDRSFAVLGIANGLETATPFPELQLKLRTKDPEVIQRLLQRFDDPSLVPTDLTSYWNRAVTRYELGDKTGAIADYSHMLSLSPEDAITYNYRGLAYYDTQNLDAALADFSESIRLHPHQSAAYCNRGFVRAEQGDLWGALDDYASAIQRAPDSAVAYFYRGLTQQKLDRHANAICDYSEAIQLAPQSAVTYYYRGLAQQKLGRLSEAIADLQTAVRLFCDQGSQPNAQKALKLLARLQQETRLTSTELQRPVEPSLSPSHS